MFLKNFKKKWQNKSPIEPILLFMVFFLPGLMNQTHSIRSDAFNSLTFNLSYIIIALPQIMLLLYLIRKKGNNAYEKFGIPHLSWKDVRKGGVYFAEMILAFVIIAGLMGLLSITFHFNLPEPPQNWKIENPFMLPIIFLTFLTVGYREELFFRSYLLTEFTSGGKRSLPVIIVASLLFASGHLYEGIPGFVVTFIIGIFFSFIFLKNRNVHSIALTHCFYDFSILLAGTFFT